MHLHEAIQKLRDSLSEIYPASEAKSIAHYYFECKTGFNRRQMYENRQREINLNDIEGDVKRLLAHEPVQYVTGTAWFYGMKFNVTKDVLIPRPETEELVKIALETAKSDFQRFPAPALPPFGSGQVPGEIAENVAVHYKILDIGTGSGCIAIAIKTNMPDAEVCALDISEESLKIAELNSKTNNAEIHFIKDDILQSNIYEQFSMIISNPPYITEKGKQAMLKNVLNFEPHSALFVPDDDALKFYNAIASFACKRLVQAGHLLFEINEAYKDEVCSLLEKANFINIEPHKDINNKWRIVKAQKA